MTNTLRKIKALNLRAGWYSAEVIRQHGKALQRGVTTSLDFDLQAYRRVRGGGNVMKATREVREQAFPSPLVASPSLIEALERVSGDPVAKAVLRALAFAGACNREPVGSYFSIREAAGMISYLPKGRPLVVGDSGKWERKGRVEMKYGKFARSILRYPARFSEAEYAAFALAMGADEEAENMTFTLLTTAGEINGAYDARNWGCENSDFEPSGVGSCMWGNPVGAFYTAAGAKLLVCSQRGKFILRAVVWEGVELGDEVFTFVDRLYGQPMACEAARVYIAEKGWAKKVRESNSHPGILKPDGSEVRGQYLRFDPAGNIEDVSFYPYLDTLRYYGGEYLTAYDEGESEMIFNGTAGNCERPNNHDGEVEAVDGNWIAEDEAVVIDGDYYHQDSDLICCVEGGSWELRENCYEIELSRRTIYLHEDNVNRA